MKKMQQAAAPDAAAALPLNKNNFSFHLPLFMQTKNKQAKFSLACSLIFLFFIVRSPPE
ncbi:MAG: hypothetical protein IKM70_07390 [Firmicutes bacterium]|nr:hypothetical protein [Bacillota bacterium]